MTNILEAGNAELPDGFVELPPLVYADDPMWVPENPAVVARAFAPSNGWYDSGESVAFCIPGQARLAAFRPPTFGAPDKHVYFGYFESAGDAAAEDELFERALDWAREQGAAQVFGPINHSTFGLYRIRTRNDDGGYTFLGEPFNPPRYADTIERHGFAPFKEWVTLYNTEEQCQAVTEGRIDILEDVLAAGYRIEPLTPELWMAHLEQIHPLVDEMFADAFGYTPISFEQFAAALGERYIRRVDPESSCLMWGPDGDIAAFFLIYPNWGPLTVQGAGDDRIDVIDIDWDTHWPKLQDIGHFSAVTKTAAVAPKHRNRGVFTALTIQMFLFAKGRYDRWLGSVIPASGPTRKYAGPWSEATRQYVLYGRDL